MFLFYSVMPHVMKFSSAVVVKLSLLTADIYTLFFGLDLFHFMVNYSCTHTHRSCMIEKLTKEESTHTHTQFSSTLWHCSSS